MSEALAASALVVGGLVLGSTATAAVVQGFVKLPNGTPVAGVTVTNIGTSSSAVTDATGFYSVVGAASFGTNKVVAYSPTDAYVGPVRWNPNSGGYTGGVYDLDLQVQATQAGAAYSDSFSRTGNLVGSVSEDAGHYTWASNNAPTATTDGSQANQSGRMGIGESSVNSGSYFAPADFRMTFTFSFDGGGWQTLNYRQLGPTAAPDSFDQGEMLWFAADGRVEWSGNDPTDHAQPGSPALELQSAASLPFGFSWADPHEVEFSAVGYHEKLVVDGSVWFDSLLTDDPHGGTVIYDNGWPAPETQPISGLPVGGYIGFLAQTPQHMDDLVITPYAHLVPEPASVALLGLAGLMGLTRRQRRHS
jgi:hypothetical protein